MRRTSGVLPNRRKEDLLGEVRVRVKLSNAVDESLHRRDPAACPKVRFHHGDALVDTGAVRTVIPSHIVEQIGLGIRKQTTAEFADGRKELVGVTEPVIVEIDGRDTLEDALVLGDEILIGQTVLEKLDLLVDCTNRRVIPNPAHPDRPITKVKRS